MNSLNTESSLGLTFSDEGLEKETQRIKAQIVDDARGSFSSALAVMLKSVKIIASANPHTAASMLGMSIPDIVDLGGMSDEQIVSAAKKIDCVDLKLGSGISIKALSDGDPMEALMRRLRTIGKYNESELKVVPRH